MNYVTILEILEKPANLELVKTGRFKFRNLRGKVMFNLYFQSMNVAYMSTHPHSPDVTRMSDNLPPRKKLFNITTFTSWGTKNFIYLATLLTHNLCLSDNLAIILAI